MIFDDICIVLVNILYFGNIGLVVCVMKMMGLLNLYFVDFVCEIDSYVSVFVVGVIDVLGKIVVVDMLVDVIVDCSLIIGISVCLCILFWFMVELCECGEKLVVEVEYGFVVLVFGCENSGLMNEEL